MALGSALKAFVTAAAAAAAIFSAVPSAPAQTVYPEGYNALVEQSKSESGLFVYSVIAASNWSHTLAGFKKKYPWIKVETLDLSNEIWDRYYTERATNARTADLIVAFGVDRWLQFLEKGEAVDYKSPEAASLAGWVNPKPGLFSLSVDPVLIIWNKALAGGKTFDSMAALADVAKENAGKWTGRLGTYDAGAGSLTATFLAGWAQVQGKSAWPILDGLGPLSKVERSGGTMTEKTLNGEYVASYMVGAAAFYPRLRDGAIRTAMGWSFMKDGQVAFPRGIAITKGARSPASAKLLLDYALSKEGQIGFGQGGLTPVRGDIAKDEISVPPVSEIKAIVGEANFHVLGYDQEFVTAMEPFVARWRKAFKR